jgi:hypothetical protein
MSEFLDAVYDPRSIRKRIALGLRKQQAKSLGNP